MAKTSAAPAAFDDLWVADRARQNAAFESMMDETSRPAAWAATVWPDVLANLSHTDNHNRAIAAQVLCNLAAHDPSGRIVGDLPTLVAVTRDARFVTARHCIQSLWKIGLAGPAQRAALLAAVDGRYRECGTEKNGALIRSDLIEGLRRLHDATGDREVEVLARTLIDVETDPKYRKKYSGHWR
jgi:hypothetical protein